MMHGPHYNTKYISPILTNMSTVMALFFSNMVCTKISDWWEQWSPCIVFLGASPYQWFFHYKSFASLSTFHKDILSGGDHFGSGVPTSNGSRPHHRGEVPSRGGSESPSGGGPPSEGCGPPRGGRGFPGGCGSGPFGGPWLGPPLEPMVLTMVSNLHTHCF